MPGGQTVVEDGVLIFSTMNGNAIRIDDGDPGPNGLAVLITVIDGVLSLGSTSGLTSISGNGTSNIVRIVGSLAAINNALDGLSYAPPANANGLRTLTVQTDDQGDGISGNASDIDSIQINVAAVDDAPIARDDFVGDSLEDAVRVIPFAALLANDEAVDGTPVRLGSITNISPDVGLVELDRNGPNIIFTPAANFVGRVTMTYSIYAVNDPNFTSGIANMIFDVRPVNDAPAHIVPTALAMLENRSITFSTANGNAIRVVDPDADDSSDAALATNGGVLRVVLSIEDGALTLTSIVGTTVTGNGTNAVTLTGPSMLDINAALDGLRYTPPANANGARTLRITTSDFGGTGQGGALGDSDTIAITITATNLPPSVTTGGGTAGFVEGRNATSTPIAIDPSLTLVEEDRLINGVVAITSGYVRGQDVLGFVGDATTGAIQGIWDPQGGNLLLVDPTNTATVSHYQNAMRLVTYTNLSDAPTGASREIIFAVSDGEVPAMARRTILVTEVNDAPVVTESSPSVSATEQTAVTVLPAVSIVDGDLAAKNGGAGDYAGATLFVRRASGADAQDNFGFASGAGFTVDGAALRTPGGQAFATFTLTSGYLVISFINFETPATSALVSAVAQGITYTNLSDVPPASVTISYELIDGGISGNQGGNANLSDLGLVTVAVAAVNDAPGLGNLQGDTVTLSESAAHLGQFQALDAGGNALVVDPDSADFSGGSLEVRITSGFQAAEDRLGFFAQGRVSISGNAVLVDGVAIGTFVDSGPGGSVFSFAFNAAATPGRVQLVVRDLFLANTAAEPTPGVRGLTVTLTDGDGGSTSATTSVTVVNVNDAPTIANLAGGNGTITEGTNSFTFVDVGTDALIGDVDSANFDGGTLEVRITSGYRAAEDRLGYNGNARVAILGNTVYVDSVAVGTFSGGAPGDAFLTLALSAGATPARIQEVLRAVFQSNIAAEPTSGMRGLTVTLTDGDGGSTSASASVTVVNVNDAPTITGLTGNAVTFVEDSPARLPLDVGLDAAVADADNANFNGGSLSVVIANPVASEDALWFAGRGGIGNTATHMTYNGVPFATFNAPGPQRTFVFNANATPEAVQALIRAIDYSNANQANPSTATRTVAFTLTDGSGGSVTATTTVAVTAVDDLAVALPDAATVAENATVTIAALDNDLDIDSPMSIARINQTVITVGQPVTLASGARVTLTVDGRLVYDPNGAFNGLVSAATAAATGATNIQATDSFRYVLADGIETTVTATITGVDGAGDELRGTGSADTVTGTGGDDTINLSGGGSDTASGGAGNDGFYLGGAFDSGDRLDGGAGTMDQVGLQGDYSTLLTLGTTTLTDIEMLVLLPGDDTRFGAPGNQTYSYNIRTDDANVAGGANLVVQANTLRSTETMTFDGSAETDGTFTTFGGLGTDIVTGGAGNDGFYFGQDRFNATDRVNGLGGDLDQIGLQGDYAGAKTVTFGATQLAGIEMIVLLTGTDARFGGAGTGFSYTLVMNDGNVAPGARLTIQGNTLAGSEVLTLDASGETDGGSYRVYSGAAADTITGGAGNDEIWGRLGADTLRGGAGNDVFAYLTAADSTATARDILFDFARGDRIELTRTGLSQFIGTDAFTAAGQVRVEFQNGSWFVQGDIDGDRVADLSIQVNIGSDYVWAASDFGLAPFIP